MLAELLKKLESEHGIAPAQGHGILNTITQHIKEKFPMIAGMVDNLFANQSVATTDTIDMRNNPYLQDNLHQESTLEEVAEVAKNKPMELFGK